MQRGFGRLAKGPIAAAAITVTVLVGSLAQATGAEPPRPSYVAGGDSLAVGVGTANPASEGYVALVADALDDTTVPGAATAHGSGVNGKFLALTNVARGGETTGSMISDGQLEAAADFIRAANGNGDPTDDVRVVTLSIGGNDARDVIPTCVSGLTPECQQQVASMLGAVGTNLTVILAELRSAAGPDTPIVVMTYYNALSHPGCVLHPFAPLAQVVLEGEPALGMPAGLNDVIRQVAVASGARVAETPELIGPAELTSDCIHTNEGGHAAIAASFVAAVD